MASEVADEAALVMLKGKKVAQKRGPEAFQNIKLTRLAKKKKKKRLLHFKVRLPPPPTISLPTYMCSHRGSFYTGAGLFSTVHFFLLPVMPFTQLCR